MSSANISEAMFSPAVPEVEPPVEPPLLPPEEPPLLYVLGDAYERLGLFDDAAGFAQRSLTERRALLSDSHPDIASSLSLLGWIKHRQGNSEEGAELLVQSVAMWRGLDSEDTASFARALNDLGVVYSSSV